MVDGDVDPGCRGSGKCKKHVDYFKECLNQIKKAKYVTGRDFASAMEQVKNYLPKLTFNEKQLVKYELSELSNEINCRINEMAGRPNIRHGGMKKELRKALAIIKQMKKLCDQSSGRGEMRVIDGGTTAPTDFQRSSFNRDKAQARLKQ